MTTTGPTGSSPFAYFVWLAAATLYAVAWRGAGVLWITIAMSIVLAFAFGQGAVSPQVNAIATFTHTIAALVLVAVTCRLVAAPGTHAPDLAAHAAPA